MFNNIKITFITCANQVRKSWASAEIFSRGVQSRHFA